MSRYESCPECSGVMLPVPNDEFGWMPQMRCVGCDYILEGMGICS